MKMQQAPQIIQSYSVLKNAYDLVDKGETLTGPLVGAMAAIWDPDTAQVKAAGVKQTLETLSQVTTGALSEKELGLFESLSASEGKGEAVNKRLLKLAMEAIESRVQMLINKQQFFTTNKTLKGYSETMVPDLQKLLDQGGGGGGDEDPEVQF